MVKIFVKPEWVVYPSINIEANQDYDPDIPSTDLECTLGSASRIDDDEKTIHINISYESCEDENSNLAYKIDLKLYARFSINFSLSKIQSKTKREIFEDIASLLLGSLRESVATITARGPWGAYFIPFLSFQDLAKELTDSLKDDEKYRK